MPRIQKRYVQTKQRVNKVHFDLIMRDYLVSGMKYGTNLNTTRLQERSKLERNKRPALRKRRSVRSKQEKTDDRQCSIVLSLMAKIA